MATEKTCFKSFLMAAVLALPLLVGCPPPPPYGAEYASFAPPAAEVEVVGVAPGPDHVWISGHHVWQGGRYVWVGGRWAARPRHGARWVPGHWRHNRRGWFWIEGRWR